MARISFIKAVALGNDFVIIDARLQAVPVTPHWIQHMADRHQGIGCDQVILITAPTLARADVELAFYNKDGSPAKACGNGTRCVALFLMEQEKKAEAFLQAGNLVCRASRLEDGAYCNPEIGVTMGQPRFEWYEIPLSHANAAKAVLFDGNAPICVNVGNPHAIFQVRDVKGISLTAIGPGIEKHPAFPEHVNVGFVQVMDSHTLNLRVWERGSGATLACGTGACAAAVVAIKGNCAVSSVHNPVKIVQEGGSCFVHWQPGEDMILTGSASLVFEGTVNY